MNHGSDNVAGKTAHPSPTRRRRTTVPVDVVDWRSRAQGPKQFTDGWQPRRRATGTGTTTGGVSETLRAERPSPGRPPARPSDEHRRHRADVRPETRARLRDVPDDVANTDFDATDPDHGVRVAKLAYADDLTVIGESKTEAERRFRR